MMTSSGCQKQSIFCYGFQILEVCFLVVYGIVQMSSEIIYVIG